TVRQVADALDRDFPANSTAPIEALLTTARTGATSSAALGTYLHRLDAIPGVTGAQVTGAKDGTVRVDTGSRPPTVRAAARHIVSQVRATSPPPGTTVLVGGSTAALVDELSSLGATLPWMAL